MTSLLSSLTDVTARTPDDRRRGRILVPLSLGIVALLLSVGIALTLLQPSAGRFINLGLATLVFASAALLGKKGFVSAGAYVLIVAQAARLMGAETILAGIRPEVAQTLISLGAGLNEMRTAATLQSALSLADSGSNVR